MHKRVRQFLIFTAAVIILTAEVSTQTNEGSPQSTTYSYQGVLNLNGVPANGAYDIELALYDTLTGGTLFGVAGQLNVTVTNGVFTAAVDHGALFNGSQRFVEIRVRPAGGGAYTTLSPRQPLLSTPYAIKSIVAENANFAANATTAATATNALSLGGVAANQYVLTGDVRLSDARTPTAGSPNYIQNTATQQPLSNFSISGTGSANVLNAVSQYQLNGLKLISSPNPTSLFLGFNIAPNNTGTSNSFFGVDTGLTNVAGGQNSYFGKEAGRNATGSSNSFFGVQSGFATSGDFNAFFGLGSGGSTTSGAENTFVGVSSGNLITTGSRNTMVGTLTSGTAGITNATAIGARASVTNSNSLVLGSILGINGAGSSTNVGIGTTAPSQRLHVVGDALFAGNLTVNGNITGNLPSGSASYIQNTTTQQASSNFNISGNGTAGGTLSAGTLSATSSLNLGGSQAIRRVSPTTLELGDDSDFITVLANTTRFGSTTSRGYTDIGTYVATIYGFSESSDLFSPVLIGRFARGTRTSPTFPMLNDDLFTLGGSGRAGSFWVDDSSISKISFTATEDWTSNAWGSRIDFYTAVTGTSNVTPTRIASMTNTGIGIRTTTPTADLHIVSNGGNIVLGDAGCPAGSTAIGFNGAFNNCLNYSVRGDGTALYFNRPTGGDILFREENGTTQLRLRSGGVLQLTTLGTAGSTALCRNASSDISTCSSSLRYKKNIAPFAPGLSFVRQLQPISYEWKADGNKDVGFGAEDVAKIDPRFVTYNDKGEVEGIKYDRLSVAFVNAFREQQTELEAQKADNEAQKAKIEKQQAEIESLRKELAEFKKLVCVVSQGAAICQ